MASEEDDPSALAVDAVLLLPTAEGGRPRDETFLLTGLDREAGESGTSANLEDPQPMKLSYRTGAWPGQPAGKFALEQIGRNFETDIISPAPFSVHVSVAAKESCRLEAEEVGIE